MHKTMYITLQLCIGAVASSLITMLNNKVYTTESLYWNINISPASKIVSLLQ